MKSYESKCVKNLWIFFPQIFSSRRASAPLEVQIQNWNWKDNYTLSTNAENFSFVSLILSDKKFRTPNPSKNNKNGDFSKTDRSISMKFTGLLVNYLNFIGFSLFWWRHFRFGEIVIFPVFGGVCCPNFFSESIRDTKLKFSL